MNSWKVRFRRHGLAAAIVFFVLLSLGLAIYPSISDWLSSEDASQAISSYLENSHEADRKQIETLWQQAQAYNAALDAELFPFDPDSSLHEQYEQTLLQPPQTILGVLTIERIGVHLPIYHGTDDATLQKGLGHLEGSSLPTGENGEHTLISGHSGLAGADMFDHLDQLELHDRFTLQILDRRFTYEVCDIQVVRPEDYRSVERDPGRNLVTLVTCTPYGINTHRLLVTGERIEPENPAEPVSDEKPAEDEKPVQTDKPSAHLPGWIAGVLLLFVLIGIGLAAGHRRKRKS